MTIDFPDKNVYAKSSKNYLVLNQAKNGTWKAYTNAVEVSEEGYLMLKAKRIAKILGMSYENEKDTFVIKKNATSYNTYTKNSKDFIYTKNDIQVSITAVAKACISKESGYNLCSVSSMNNLLNYKCFESLSVEEYAKYDGVICFSKYSQIPENVPIVKLDTTKKVTPTPTPEPELKSIMIEGVEFPVRTQFLSAKKVFSDWGGTLTQWDELEQNMDGSLIETTKLWVDSKSIEFSHQGKGFDGITLSKTSNGYKIAISVQLNGSVVASQNGSILKAMITTISSKPLTVYDAIYNSFTSTNSYGINEETYVVIGDCKIKVGVKNGIVTYYITE